MKLCFKIFGLAEDENGNKDYGGIQLEFGKTEKECDYAKLTKDINKRNLLKMMGLDTLYRAADVEIITPEEYARDYG